MFHFTLEPCNLPCYELHCLSPFPFPATSTKAIESDAPFISRHTLQIWLNLAFGCNICFGRNFTGKNLLMMSAIGKINQH
jgi:hypothetical protein